MSVFPGTRQDARRASNAGAITNMQIEERSTVNKIKLFLSPCLFGLVLICFLFPFVSIVILGSFSGVDIIMKIFSYSDFQSALDSYALAALAALLSMPVIALIGLVSGLGHSKSSRIISCFMGVWGFAAAVGLLVMIHSEAVSEGLAGIQIEPAYYLVILFFLGAAVSNLVLLLSKDSPVSQARFPAGASGIWQASPSSLPGQIPGPAGQIPVHHPPAHNSCLDAVRNWKFCPQCGTRNLSSNDYCNQCGNRFPEIAASPHRPG